MSLGINEPIIGFVGIIWDGKFQAKITSNNQQSYVNYKLLMIGLIG